MNFRALVGLSTAAHSASSSADGVGILPARVDGLGAARSLMSARPIEPRTQGLRS